MSDTFQRHLAERALDSELRRRYQSLKNLFLLPTGRQHLDVANKATSVIVLG